MRRIATAPDPDLTIRVAHVLAYRDTAEIRAYLRIMDTMGLVPTGRTWYSEGDAKDGDHGRAHAEAAAPGRGHRMEVRPV